MYVWMVEDHACHHTNAWYITNYVTNNNHVHRRQLNCHENPHNHNHDNNNESQWCITTTNTPITSHHRTGNSLYIQHIVRNLIDELRLIHHRQSISIIINISIIIMLRPTDGPRIDATGWYRGQALRHGQTPKVAPPLRPQQPEVPPPLRPAEPAYPPTPKQRLASVAPRPTEKPTAVKVPYYGTAYKALILWHLMYCLIRQFFDIRS